MILQIAPGEGVECRERLVEQQHFRLRYQRTRDRHPLRLPAGEFPRPGVGLVRESDPGKRTRDLLPPHISRQAGQPEADIVGDAEPGQQARLLEDDADLRMRRDDRRLVEQDPSGAGAVKAGDRPQQRRFSAARTADDGDDLAGAISAEKRSSAWTPFG